MKPFICIILTFIALLFWNCPKPEEPCKDPSYKLPISGFKVYQIIKYIDPLKTTDWSNPVYVNERKEVNELKINCLYEAVANEPNATFYGWSRDSSEIRKDFDTKQSSGEFWVSESDIKTGYNIQLFGYTQNLKCWPYKKDPIDFAKTFPVTKGKNLLNLSFAGAFLDSLNVPVIMTFKNGCWGDKSKPSLYVNKGMISYCTNVSFIFDYISDTIFFRKGPRFSSCTSPCNVGSNIDNFEFLFIKLNNDSLKIISTFNNNGYYNRVFKGKKI